MREHATVGPQGVTLPTRLPHRRLKNVERGDVTIPREVLDALSGYDMREVSDAVRANRLIGPHVHAWTTAGDIARQRIVEPVRIIWHEMDYDMDYWETMDVAFVRRDDNDNLWFYSDPEVVKAEYLKKYPDDAVGLLDEDWVEMARSDCSFYETQPVLVLREHPTLF